MAAAEASEEELTAMEAELHHNPYLYDTHIKYIAALRTTSDTFKIRLARENMSKVFPLTEALWLEWIHDELRTGDSLDYVSSLFDRSFKDYLCPNAWLEFVQLKTQLLSSEDEEEQMREVYERAVAAIGLHALLGSSLWSPYRAFEQAIFDRLVEKKADAAEIVAARDRVLKLFRRQLGIPLIGMREVHEEYHAWLAQHSLEADSATETAFAKAAEVVDELGDLETLVAAGGDTTTAFHTYILFELEQESNPARVQLVYERAVEAAALDAGLWLGYCKYLDLTVKLTGEPSLHVHERSIRNCPWSAALWHSYLRQLERTHAPQEQYVETFQRALQSGISQPGDILETWMLMCEYFARHITLEAPSEEAVAEWRSAVQQAEQYLFDTFGRNGDPSARLPLYQARFEARRLRNLDGARAALEEATRKGHGGAAEVWLEHCRLERTYGTLESARKTFKQAVECVNDFPESVCEAYLQFEREDGTIKDWDAASVRVEARLAVVAERRMAATEKEGAAAEKKSEHASKQKKGKGEEEGKKAKKRDKREDEEEGQAGQDRTKRTRVQGKQADSNSKPEPMHADGDGHDGQHDDEHQDPHPFDENTAKRTVFVSNLLLTTDEARIRALLEPLGPIKDIRLARKPNGQSRCFAYVEFESPEPAALALKMDRTPLDGRPAFISACVDKKKTPTQFRFSTALDRKTLYVSNISFEATSADLEAVFAKYGQLVGVRMVTKRSGAPKGFAYVEYADATSAARAVLAVNDQPLKGRPLSVALSQPPARDADGKAHGGSGDASRKGASGAVGGSSTGGSGDGVFLAPPPRRPAVNAGGAGAGAGAGAGKFMPRAMLGTKGRAQGRVQVSDGPGISGGAAEATSSAKGGEGSAGVSAPKSNSDFRAMLLKK